MTITPQGAVTIGDLIRAVLGQPQGTPLEEPPVWPPDVFAVTATVLKRTGTYLCIVGGKSRVSGESLIGELRNIQAVAADWQRQAGGNADAGSVPDQVRQWWQQVTTADALTMPADELLVSMRQERKGTPQAECSRRVVWHLFRLMIAADEACRGAGLLDLRADGDPELAGFYLRCANNLFWRWWYPQGRRSCGSTDPLSSLCEQVHPTRAVVLPKIHVSQAGLTLNNLSRHLALCDIGSDVAPVWRWIPSTYHLRHETAGINLLVIPSPSHVPPSSFRETRKASASKDSGYFTCGAGSLTKADRKRIIAAASLVEKEHGRLDVLVLPEMATSTSDFEKLCYELGHWVRQDLPARDGIVVVAGVAERTSDHAPGEPFSRNNVAVSSHLAGIRIAPGRQQSKHHRWRLDGAQVRQYGLGSQLDPNKTWWEDIDISQRAIFFWSAGWLTASVLICEDLARQEPIAEVVRAVGPNLVVALLADGPQHQDRWSARYATVLADDPGCSVLTLTSLGMATMSRPPGKAESRVIALWKDATDGAIPIDFPSDAFGVVLSLTKEPAAKTTADGRSGAPAYDQPGSHAARLKLSGIHPVTERDLAHYPGEKLTGQAASPMLQPYQSAAIAVTLFSLIRSGSTPGTTGWPSALRKFADWLPAPDEDPPDEKLWQAVGDEDQLKPLVRLLDGIGEIDDLEPWAQLPALELKTLVTQLRKRRTTAETARQPHVPPAPHDERSSPPSSPLSG